MSQPSNVSHSTEVFLLRNRTGNTIHRVGCVAVNTRAVRWRWADANPDEDWKQTAPWLHPCQRCNPPSPLSSAGEVPDLMEALKRSLAPVRDQNHQEESHGT